MAISHSLHLLVTGERENLGSLSLSEASKIEQHRRSIRLQCPHAGLGLAIFVATPSYPAILGTQSGFQAKSWSLASEASESREVFRQG
jgi:hypothetical protein